MKDSIIFRKAIETDAEDIWQIILQAKEQMRLLNSLQWQSGYPAFETIIQDIENGYGYVFYLDNEVIAYGAVSFDGEPAYNSIKGKWLSEKKYVVLHRLAVSDKMKQQGIATFFMQKVEELSRQNNVYSFRVDTNFDNHYVQRMLSKLDFSYCGEIFYDRGTRMAYEKEL